MRIRGSLIGGLVFVLLAVAPLAAAQQYPPPVPAPESCVRATSQTSFGASVDGVVEAGGSFTLSGAAGCSEPNTHCDVMMESERVHLGTLVSMEDGSYSLSGLTVPADTEPGRHRLILVHEGRDVMARFITVVSDLDAYVRNGGELGVGSQMQPATGNGDGQLPRTGASVLRLIAMGLAFTATGSGMAAGAWKLRTRRRARATDPVDGVPNFDTTGFVPLRGPGPTPE